VAMEFWRTVDERFCWSERYVTWRIRSEGRRVLKETQSVGDSLAKEEDVEARLLFLEGMRISDRAQRLHLDVEGVLGDCDADTHEGIRRLREQIRQEENARAATRKAKLEPWHVGIQIIGAVAGLIGGLLAGWLAWGRH
jgi:hypothetical protein